VCHDFEDAVDARIVAVDHLPEIVRSRCGESRGSQLSAFITSMIRAAMNTGRVGMEPPVAEALAEFRRFNYERVYLRPESRAQATAVIDLLRALVEHYTATPALLPTGELLDRGSDEARFAAVSYVAGMTDRFACRQGTALLGWDAERLPKGIDV